jgi:hypothetical protein
MKAITKPIKQEIPYTPEIGDILSGAEFIKRTTPELEDFYEWNYFPANSANLNVWESLKKFGIDISELRRTVEYQCPWSNNRFYHFLPIVVIANDLKLYRECFHGDDYMFLGKDMGVTDKYVFDLNEIHKSMMGHGYTEFTLPIDGHGKWIKVLVELENHDFLFGYCWEWYNK